MTINRVSFLGTSQAQISRLQDLNSTLAELSRQLTARTKHTTLAGFGADAGNVVRNRVERNKVDSYLANIDTVTNRIKQMETAMTALRDSASQIVTGIATGVNDGTADVKSLSALAKNVLSFAKDLVNLKSDGRYLFAGSDSASAPLQDSNALNSNNQANVTAWLNGTITTDQLTAATTALTTTQLGMNAGLSASGNVTARISETAELDYTVRADQDGMQEMIRALGLMANLKEPAAGDTPDAGEANKVMQYVLTTLQNGIKQLDSADMRLGTNYNLVKELQSTHEADSAMLDNLIGDAEDVDTTDVAAKIQSLQTQLQASYQVTNIVSNLSLVNFIN